MFGRRAGLAAAKHAKEISSPTIDPAQVDAAEKYALEPFQRQHGESPYAIHRDLQKTMQSLVGIFRTRTDVEQALTELEKLNERYKLVSVEGSRMFNPGWHLALDLHSMLKISEAVAKCALVREESRGAHSRIDFPDRFRNTANTSAITLIAISSGESAPISIPSGACTWFNDSELTPRPRSSSYTFSTLRLLPIIPT